MRAAHWTGIVVFALLVAGALAAIVVSSREDPPDRYTLSASWPGVSPVDVEQLLCEPMSMALSGTARSVLAVAHEGMCELEVMVEAGTDRMLLVDAMQRVSLPPDADTPLLHPAAGRAEIRYVLAADASLRELSALHEAVLSKLRELPTVDHVATCGVSRDELEVRLPPAALRRYGLDAADVLEALRDAPGDVDSLEQTTIGPVRLGDVATLTSLDSPGACTSRWSGRNAIMGRVDLAPGAEPDSIVDALPSFELPPHAELITYRVDSEIGVALPAGTSEQVAWDVAAELSALFGNDGSEPPVRVITGTDPLGADVIARLPRPTIVLVATEEISFSDIAQRVASVPGTQLFQAPGARRFFITADERPTLEGRSAATVAEEIRSTQGVESVALMAPRAADELRIGFDRPRLAELGVSTGRVAQLIRLATDGVLTGIDDDVRVVWGDGLADDADALMSLLVTAPNGQEVPLSALAELSYGPGRMHRIQINHRPAVLMTVWFSDESVADDIVGPVQSPEPRGGGVEVRRARH